MTQRKQSGKRGKKGAEGVDNMDRLTRMLNSSNGYVVDESAVEHGVDGYSGDAVSRLAKFENFYEDLVTRQDEIIRELEKLRSEGKTHSVKFKQLFTNKLANNNILILIRSYGL